MKWFQAGGSQPARKENRIPKPVLEVACQKGAGYDFGGRLLRDAIGGILLDARKRAEKSGNFAPLVVLFSESDFSYRFNITKDEAARGIDSLWRAFFMNEDVWAGAAFVVMVNDGKCRFSSEGIMMTPDGWAMQPKRRLTDYDSDLVFKKCEQDAGNGATEGAYDWETRKQIYGAAGDASSHWNSRGKNMTEGKMPYLTVAIPCGLVVEHRICADAEGEPVENGLDAIAAVSARGIYRGQLDALDLQRRLVIINDSSPAKRAAGICTIGNNNLKPVRETNENEFTRFTIYD